MLMDYLILIFMGLIGFVGFFLFISKDNRRKGLLAVMMFQAIIWFCDIPSLSFSLISAPVRELPNATDIPLTIDYFFYPVLFSIFYNYKRKNKKLWSRFTYFMVWVTAITIFDFLIERHTNLLVYEHITWYWMWIYIGFLFYIGQVCCNYFFKGKAMVPADSGGPHEN